MDLWLCGHSRAADGRVDIVRDPTEDVEDSHPVEGEGEEGMLTQSTTESSLGFGRTFICTPRGSIVAVFHALSATRHNSLSTRH